MTDLLHTELSFFERVYQVARKIPAGRVTSYGAIARAIGAGKSARMVGYAMNASHNLPDIPAHRVVNRNGLLTGKAHFGTDEMMRKLLEAEGIQVQNNKVIEFEKIFWDPFEELELL